MNLKEAAVEKDGDEVEVEIVTLPNEGTLFVGSPPTVV